MEKIILGCLFLILILSYNYQKTIVDNQETLYSTIIKDNNEAWEKHSDLPTVCYSCHSSYYNRIDNLTSKFTDWKELHSYITCKDGFKDRRKQGNKMPCLQVEPLISKSVYKIMK